MVKQSLTTTLFRARLVTLAKGRKLTPWLTGLGFKKHDITHINLDRIPGPEKLALLAEAENVNLSWLVAGVGEPYITRLGAREMPAQYSGRPTPTQQLVDLLPQLPDDAVKALLKTAQLMTLKK